MCPEHQTSERFPFWTNPEAKNAELILLKNEFLTLRFLNFSPFFRKLWVLPGSDFQYVHL